MNPEQILKKIPEISSFLKLGTSGFYPLFDNDFIEDLIAIGSDMTPIKDHEKRRFVDILHGLTRYSSLSKKRIYLSALKEDERRLFTKGFLKLVENSVIDQRPCIH